MSWVAPFSTTMQQWKKSICTLFMHYHNISYHLAEVACSKTRNSRTRKQWNTECRNTKSEMVKPRTLNLEHQNWNSKTGSSTSGMVNLEHQIWKTDLSSPIIGWNKKIRNSKTRNTESGRVPPDMEMTRKYKTRGNDKSTSGCVNGKKV